MRTGDYEPIDEGIKFILTLPFTIWSSDVIPYYGKVICLLLIQRLLLKD